VRVLRRANGRYFGTWTAAALIGAQSGSELWAAPACDLSQIKHFSLLTVHPRQSASFVARDREEVTET
jgi:hypothetical protein